MRVTCASVSRRIVAVLSAAVLVAGMMPGFGSGALAGDATSAGSAFAESATAGAEGQGVETANSWRYRDGNLLSADEIAPGATDGQVDGATDDTDMLYLASTGSWSYVDGHFVNDQGEVIESAVAKGVDVSEHQGTIDWEKVKADGVDFAIIRCGYGNDDASQDDACWEYNVSECERLGIPYGVYLYSYAASTDDAQSEANHVLRLLEGHNPTYPVYYDLEEDSMIGQNQFLADISTVFCESIRNAGHDVGVYSSLNWWNGYLTDSCFDNWERWVAQWNHACSYTGTYHVWQCASDGTIDGIDGNVDIDFEMDWSHAEFVDPFTFEEDENPSDIRLAMESAVIGSKSATDKVVDVVAGSKNAGANATTWTKTSHLWQLFRLETDDEGFTRIVSRNSGLYLGVYSSEFANGTNVCQLAEGEGTRVQWVMEEAPSGSYYLRMRGTNLYLDVSGGVANDGTNLQLWTRSACNGRLGQMFTFAEDTERIIDDGFYIIRSADDTNYVADVVAGSIDDGANVTLWNYTGANNQIFQIYRMYDSYYKVAAVCSWRALDVVAGGTTDGTNVTQWCQYDTDNQAWIVELNDDGTFSFKAKCSGLYLDVQGGHAGAGANLWTWEETDNNSGLGQRFVLEATSV